jgi:glycine/D-amino acid oxidase-like deaminating enzyme
LSAAIVIGGGFYGASIAVHLKRVRGLDRVTLVECGKDLLTRSSFVNQARVHTGYHYPRSFTTAYRSIINVPRFVQDFGPAVGRSHTNLYAVARKNSKITPRQMERFCQEIGAPLETAPPELQALFNPQLIDRVYLTDEAVFDAEVLRRIMRERLASAGVEVRLETEALRVVQGSDHVEVEVQHKDRTEALFADVAFNCTYSRLQTLLDPNETVLKLKHEISEMVLIDPPDTLKRLGITVMDGAFFSMMPFPARRLHSLSHVRYTPHAFWMEDGAGDPYARLADYHFETRADRMIRDCARYVPELARAKPERSLFEVKTVLTANETDDGRPILMRRHEPYGRLFSVLGGKIDNVYDILDQLDRETLPLSQQRAKSWTH